MTERTRRALGAWGALVVAFAGCAVRSAGPGPKQGAARRVVILACNDVYRLEGVEDGARGGFARLRALRQRLEREHGPVLLLHAGDFLAPSFLSRMFRGEQMVDVMNLLDGDAAAFDRNMAVTFGNHEFDARELADAPALDARIAASQFTWLGTNVTFGRGADGAALVEDPHLHHTAIFDIGGMRVGLFSVTTDVSRPAYVASFAPYEETARRTTAELRAAGCDLVVALTHLELSQDRALLQALGDAGPDLVIGGHDHEGSETLVGGRYVLKADADLRTATVVEVELPAAGRPRVTPRRVPLDGAVTPDPEIHARVASWLDRHAQTFCARAKRADGCLDEPLSKAAATLEAEELLIRRFETNLGDWIADVARDAFAGRGAQGAFLNGGGLRLNQDLPQGTVITQRHLEELFAYPAPLRMVALDGRTLTKVLERSIEDWTGNGWWLQISGIAFRHDPETGRVSDVTLLAPEGPRPVRPDETLRLVTVDFLVEPKWGQDGYTMLTPAHVVDRGEDVADLKELVAAALRRAGPQGIAPPRDGRICNPQRPGPCLAQGR